VVQRKEVWKSIDDGLAELQRTKVCRFASGRCNILENVLQVIYSGELSQLTTRWAMVEEKHRRLYAEHSRVKQQCGDLFLQSNTVCDTIYGLVPS
jgi:hypothetical protein